MVAFGSLIFFGFFSILTHHPISVHGSSETQDSNTTSASSPPSPKSIPIRNVKYHFSVPLPGQSSSDIEARGGSRTDLSSVGFSKCEDGRFCGPDCDDPKELHIWSGGGGRSINTIAQFRDESIFCISGRCGYRVGSGSIPICGEGNSSNCENGKVCDPNCPDAAGLRASNKVPWGSSKKYDLWKKEQQKYIDEFKLGKFCKSGLCVIADYAYVCGTIGLRQASISLPIIFLIPSLLIAKTLI